MAYPRRCPLCGADYDPRKVERLDHATLQADPGGTPSHWRPRLPGRLLTLHCLLCEGAYRWDYFAGRPSASPRPGPPLPQPYTLPARHRRRAGTGRVWR